MAFLVLLWKSLGSLCLRVRVGNKLSFILDQLYSWTLSTSMPTSSLLGSVPQRHHFTIHIHNKIDRIPGIFFHNSCRILSEFPDSDAIFFTLICWWSAFLLAMKLVLDLAHHYLWSGVTTLSSRHEATPNKMKLLCHYKVSTKLSSWWSMVGWICQVKVTVDTAHPWLGIGRGFFEQR